MIKPNITRQSIAR